MTTTLRHPSPADTHPPNAAQRRCAERLATELTPRRSDVLCAIASSIRARGYSPTLRELCALLGISSFQSMSRHVCGLERSGHISRGVKGCGTTWRSIRITPVGEAALGLQQAQDPFAAETAIERLEMGA